MCESKEESILTFGLLRGVSGGGVLDVQPRQPDVRRPADVDVRPEVMVNSDSFASSFVTHLYVN